VSAESHGWAQGAARSIEESRAAIDPPQFRAREGPRHPTETSLSDTAARTSKLGQRCCETMYFTLTSGGSRREYIRMARS
jgi:hypothetical protein